MRRLAAILAAWLVVAVVNGGQHWLLARLRGTPIPFAQAFGTNFSFLIVWAAATPGVLYTARRFPIQRATLVRHGIVHLGFGVTFVIALNALGALWSWHPAVPWSFGAWVRTTATHAVWFGHIALLVYLTIVAIGHVLTHPRHAAQKSADAGLGEQAAPLDRIAVRRYYRTHLIAATEVDWLEASGDHVILHRGHHTDRVRDTLKGLHARLDPRRFVRVHRSAVVNIDRITEVQTYFHGDCIAVLEGGRHVRVSRTRRAELEKAIGHRV